MSTKRELILAALPSLWVDVLGIDEDEAHVDPEANLIDWLKSLGDGVYEELDFADVHARLQSCFGMTAPLEAMDEYFGNRNISEEEWKRIVKPTLTISRFADWIAKYTPVPSYSPISIAGHRCQLAGTFRGIEDVVQSVAASPPSFSPSTLIIQTIRGKELANVWDRLQLHSMGRLRKLDWPWEGLASLLLFISFSSGLIAILMSFTSLWFLCVAGWTVAVTGFWIAIRLQKLGNPLPSGINTFRDLTEEMSQALQE